MPHVSVRGFDLYVEEVGVGPDLVIAHGLFGSIAGAVANGLAATDIAARGFHVVQYDARGHGRSAPGMRAADYRWDALADELIGVMDALGLKRTSVLGTSMGAGAALLAALRAPERFERLILRMPPAMGPDLRLVRWRMGTLRALHGLLGAAATTTLLRASGQARLAQRLRQQQAGVVPKAIGGLVFGPSQLSEWPLNEIRCPALILTQPGDPEHPIRSGEILGHMSRAILRVAPTPGYWLANAEELTSLTTGFLRSEPC